MIKQFIIIVFIISCSCENTKQSLAPSIMIIDEYHGQKIEDPYRNLENIQDSLVVNWFRRQGEHASEVLKKIPGRQLLIDKQIGYDIAKEFTIDNVKFVDNGKYFYLKTLVKDNVAKLYYRLNINENEILIYDPTIFSKDEKYLINHFNPDWSGEKVAVGLSKKGEKTSKILVVEVSTKNVLPGIIQKSLTGTQWLSDNSGFVYKYSPFNDPSYNPILFNVSFEDGHGGMSNSRLERFEKYADAASFAFWHTGHPNYQPK